MEARMTNPAKILPDAMTGINALYKATMKGGVPDSTMALVQVRASQINGCSWCALADSRRAKEAGETEERLFTVAAWREAPYFTDAERAALALTEAATRLSEREDGVPDDVWDEATKHYDEAGLSALLLMIALANTFNLINVTTRQVAGSPNFA